jgi:hypothetical protein
MTERYVSDTDLCSECLLQVGFEYTYEYDQGGKVKVKVKVKITLEQATKAQRGSRCTVLLFL